VATRDDRKEGDPGGEGAMPEKPEKEKNLVKQ